MIIESVSDKLVDAYLIAQKQSCEEQERWREDGFGIIKSRIACREGLKAAMLASINIDRQKELSENQERFAYGIIDPDYARIFTITRTLAWAEGYSISMHGSFTRDLDLLACPWTESAREPEHLARRIEDAVGMRMVNKASPGIKPHGRRVWTMVFPTFGDPRFLDLSIMPRIENKAQLCLPLS